MVLLKGDLLDGYGGSEEAAQIPYGGDAQFTAGGGFAFITPPAVTDNGAPHIIREVPAEIATEVPGMTGQPALKVEDGGNAGEAHNAVEGTTTAQPAAASPAAQVTASLGNTQKTALIIGGVVLAVILLLFLFMPKSKAA